MYVLTFNACDCAIIDTLFVDLHTLLDYSQKMLPKSLLFTFALRD